jgi:hypothetical protein
MSRSERAYRAETEFLDAKRKRNLARCPVTTKALELVQQALETSLPAEVRGRLEINLIELAAMLEAGYDLRTTDAAQLTTYIAQNAVPAGVAK